MQSNANLDNPALPHESDQHSIWPGQLQRYTFPGGYSVRYLMADGESICADCANGENGSETMNPDPDYQGDPQWQILESYIHWEGPPEQCAHCNREMESEYGDPEQEENGQ